MNQYFEVGEEVILQPVNPKARSVAGQVTTVIMVVTPQVPYNCPHCGVGGYIVGSEICYHTSTMSPSDCCDVFRQASLRKKYPPSDESFSELMQSLSKKGVEV